MISRYGEHKFGDKVTEAHFYQGIAEQLLGSGSLERDFEDTDQVRIDPGPIEVRATEVLISDKTRLQIMSELNGVGVFFMRNESKIELFEKWKKHFKK